MDDVPLEPMPEHLSLVRDNEDLVAHDEDPPVAGVGPDSRRDAGNSSELARSVHKAINQVREDVAILGHDEKIVSVGQQPLVEGPCSDWDRARYRWNANRYAHRAIFDGVTEDAPVRRHDEDTTALNENPFVFRAHAHSLTERLRFAEACPIDRMGKDLPCFARHIRESMDREVRITFVPQVRVEARCWWPGRCQIRTAPARSRDLQRFRESLNLAR